MNLSLLQIKVAAYKAFDILHDMCIVIMWWN